MKKVEETDRVEIRVHVSKSFLEKALQVLTEGNRDVFNMYFDIEIDDRVVYHKNVSSFLDLKRLKPRVPQDSEHPKGYRVSRSDDVIRGDRFRGA